MKSLIFEKMYELTKKPYQKWFKKNEPWDIGIRELLDYPQDSLGFHLGHFLADHHFDLQPKLEDHDIIHVLTDTGVTVEDEIGMQFYLLGNGKRSLYVYMVVASGSIFYPCNFAMFLACYRRGKKAHRFHDLDFYKMLAQPIACIRQTFSIC